MHFIVRPAYDLDLMRLINLGEAYYKEVDRWHNYELDRERLMTLAMTAIQSETERIFLAIDIETNNIHGLLWGCVVDQVWTKGTIGHDRFLFVSPEVRKQGIGKALILSFIRWCEAKDCISIQAGANSGIQDDDPAIKVYQSLGFQSGGKCFNLQL